MHKINLQMGDITRSKTQVIVNAANRYLIAGGGVDGAIHRAAGPRLQLELNDLAQKLPGKELRTGGALLTPSFDMAEYVSPQFIIHCVGPIFPLSQNPAEELASCYREALKICRDLDFRSIAFPSISTGIYKYPLHEAAKIAVLTVMREIKTTSLEHCDFILFDEDTFSAYKNAKIKVEQLEL